MNINIFQTKVNLFLRVYSLSMGLSASSVPSDCLSFKYFKNANAFCIYPNYFEELTRVVGFVPIKHWRCIKLIPNLS